MELKKEGVIGSLGVSAQTPAELNQALTDAEAEMIQLPFNLLDKRWDGSVVRKRPDLLVHARSVFLQGLLAETPVFRWPRIPDIDVTALTTTLSQLVAELGRRSLADLAVAYVRAHSWIHSLVIGMETEAQLEENLRLMTAPALDEAGVTLVDRRLPRLPDELLDPAKWPMS
jgi:aryl-alcohol dehydrogenase-like predicted oxidoreductase